MAPGRGSKDMRIVIDTSAVLLTFKCNLRCKLCCTASPYQKNPQHFPLAVLNESIARYFSIVSYIRKLSFGGGEPFLRADICDLIQATLRHAEQFNVLEIITNGTIVPPEPVLNCLQAHNDKMFVMIDHYGDISRNAQRLSEALALRAIDHEVRIYHGADAHCGGWVNLGDYAYKHDAETAKALFGSCVISQTVKQRTGRYTPIQGESSDVAFPYLAMTMGVLHRCARSYSTMQANSISADCGDFIDIMDTAKSVDAVQNEMKALFHKEYLQSCQYCNGFSSASQRYLPAEQLE